MTRLNNPAIKALAKRIYAGLPGKIKPCFTPLLSGYRKFKQVYLPVFLFSGETKTQGISFTFAYVGTNLNHQAFWSRLVLRPGMEKTFIGNHFLLNIPTLLRSSPPLCSMILWETSPAATAYFNTKPNFRIPKWINMEIDISRPIDALCRGNKAYKDIRRRINKHNYTYLMTQKADDYEYFYDHLYVPYIKSRFINCDIILPKSTILDEHTSKELLLIKQGASIVAGAVVKHHAGKAILAWFGVLQGNFDHVREGVFGAGYYYAIMEMQKRGFTKLNIGDSRPILNQGATWHKTKLLARLADTQQTSGDEHLLLALLHDSPGLRDFLANNQIVYLSKDNELRSTCWIEQQSLPSTDTLADTARLSERIGFRRHHVLFFSHSHIPQGWLDFDRPRHLLIDKAHDYFWQHKANDGRNLWG